MVIVRPSLLPAIFIDAHADLEQSHTMCARTAFLPHRRRQARIGSEARARGLWHDLAWDSRCASWGQDVPLILRAHPITASGTPASARGRRECNNGGTRAAAARVETTGPRLSVMWTVHGNEELLLQARS
jgi:hypothetical protein